MSSISRASLLFSVALMGPALVIGQIVIPFTGQSSDETPASVLKAGVSVSYNRASGLLTLRISNRTAPPAAYTVSALFFNTSVDVGSLLLNGISGSSPTLLANQSAGPFGTFDWKIDFGQGNRGVRPGDTRQVALTALGANADLGDFFSERSVQRRGGKSDRRAFAVIFFTQGPGDDGAFGTSKGAIVGPTGGTVEGPDGSTVTVQPGSLPYTAYIDISPAAPSDIEASLGNLQLVGAVKISFDASEFGSSLHPPSLPFQISIPAPLGLAASNFVVAQQVLVDRFTGPEPGLADQLVPVDTAALTGTQIVTDNLVFPGAFGGGLFVFVANTGSGFATGVVSDLTGAQSGVVVSNNTNPLVSITDGTGRYILFINGGPFTVTGFHPFKGTLGFGFGIILLSGSTVSAPIFLLPELPTPLIITRDGIRNGGFERGDLSSWGTSGAAGTVQQLGPTSTGVVIRPTEGKWMADINTGSGSVGGVGSTLNQRFRVPAGVRTLRLDFNFVSEEFPEFVGSIFNDAFRAIITTPDGASTFAQVSVNQSGGFTLIGDCFFPGGDSTCGQTGWREGSVDLSAFAGTDQMIGVDLLFSSNDAGDNIYDTHVLIDNIRFSTVWVDSKAINGADASAARIHQDILGATEILSQAGINVRLRDFQTIADPGGLLATDITAATECRPALLCSQGLGQTKLVPTTEELQLMGLARSAMATDVNAYYVRSMTKDGDPGGVAGFAVGPDDFHDVEILTNAGTILQDLGGCRPGGHILAHELGHLLISPERAGDVLEHAAGTSNFLGGTCVAPLSGILNRQQSADINRVGAPLLVP